MRPTSRWRRVRDVVLSTDPRRRLLVSMSLLALLLMASSAGVMLLVAAYSSSVNAVAVQWWAAMSVGGLAVMTAFIRSGETSRLNDPSLTVPQMVWTITSGAVAYVLAGDARGVVPSVLAMILFFGTFGLTVAEVIGIGVYALLAQAGPDALAVNRELATRDELTGLPNRRAMQDLMDLEHRRTLRSGRPMLLAQLDIDHFKRINDSHGHATGDRALQAFAGVVRANVRDTDVLARWGGEEFVLMLSETQLEDGRELVERVRQAVAGIRMPHASGTLQMTVSRNAIGLQP